MIISSWGVSLKKVIYEIYTIATEFNTFKMGNEDVFPIVAQIKV